jgi:hypothetical protein
MLYILITLKCEKLMSALMLRPTLDCATVFEKLFLLDAGTIDKLIIEPSTRTGVDRDVVIP